MGTELTAFPDVAIVVPNGRLHAILRGDITLVAHTGGTADVASGRNVTTWSERSLPLPVSFMLAFGDPGTEEPLVLPVDEAVVRMQSLSMGLAAPSELRNPAADVESYAGSDHEADNEEFKGFAIAAEAADAEWNA